MEENKNTEPDQPAENIPEVEQSKTPPSSGVIIVSEETAVPESETSDIIHSKSNIKNMEVHHHGHVHETKKWKEYIFQFLMLFLAVFCGFLAEYQLEHVIENGREIKFAESLIEDLKKDTSDLNQDIPFWNKLINKIDTIQTELDKTEQERNALLLYRSVAFIRSYDNFEYHDRTIEQLKNGGNFRLIRKKAVANSIIDYDAMIKSALRDQEIQSNAIYQQLNFLQDKLFNSRGYGFVKIKEQLDSLIKTNPGILLIRNGKNDELFEYYNHLDYYRLMNKYRNGTNKQILKMADSLINQIKIAYQLK